MSKEDKSKEQNLSDLSKLIDSIGGQLSHIKLNDEAVRKFNEAISSVAYSGDFDCRDCMNKINGDDEKKKKNKGKKVKIVVAHTTYIDGAIIKHKEVSFYKSVKKARKDHEKVNPEFEQDTTEKHTHYEKIKVTKEMAETLLS